VITGAFSLTRPSVQLGYLPRLKVTHISSRHLGKIYTPQVNWASMTATILLVTGFQTSG
jgi:KUP system potassium uptake protein